MREQIKNQIKNTVTVIDTDSLEFVSLTDYAHLAEGNVWSRAIETALSEKKNVYIPDIGKDIYINEPIFMDSGCNLKVADTQTIRLKPGTNTCMIRNRNIIPGNTCYVETDNPDEYITVSGGIWCSAGNERLSVDGQETINGGFSHFQFSNVQHLNIRNITFLEGSKSYAVQIGNCNNFYVDNIRFFNHKKDGIHIDGPSKYGIISNLSGENLGDDMVAILAWDWYRSAVSFGDIEYILVENVEGDGNELRLLAGRKVYPNKLTKDCAVKNCVIENVSGIYTHKMYYQPNCVNAYRGKYFDAAATVGEMTNIYFKDISFPCLKSEGFNNIPVYGLFDILADCKNLNFENISVEQSVEELDAMGVKLVNVGPISATRQRGNGPEDWGELFDPDCICTVEDIALKNISFNGKHVTDAEKLVKETRQTVNPDYPNTIPAGGTGFGKVEKVTVE